MPLQRSEARQIVMAGADVMVCHHTHTLQTIETFRGKKIYYSIGNFIFDQPKPLNSRAAMVRINVDRDSLTVETVPVNIRQCVPYVEHER